MVERETANPEGQERRPHNRLIRAPISDSVVTALSMLLLGLVLISQAYGNGTGDTSPSATSAATLSRRPASPVTTDSLAPSPALTAEPTAAAGEQPPQPTAAGRPIVDGG